MGKDEITGRIAQCRYHKDLDELIDVLDADYQMTNDQLHALLLNVCEQLQELKARVKHLESPSK